MDSPYFISPLYEKNHRGYYALSALIGIKPVIDAMYGIAPVKYIYMGLISVVCLLLSRNRNFQWKGFEGVLTTISLLMIYFLYKTEGEAIAFVEFLKIVSPMLLILLVLPRVNMTIVYGLLFYAYFNIMLNALLLPFDFGWVTWGDIKTFKGIYYFKTDMAFSVNISLIIIFIYKRFTMDVASSIAIILSSVEIFYSNSRANYIIVCLIVIFVVISNKRSVKTLISYSVYFIFILILFFYNFDNATQLSFDFDDLGKLTQGRNVVWDILINNGFSKFGSFDWLLGKGYFADYWINYYSNFSVEVYNAHNDFLYLVYNYGIIGFIVVYAFWVLLIKKIWGVIEPTEKMGLIIIATCYVTQGISAVMTSYASKTWGVAYVILLTFGLSNYSANQCCESTSEEVFDNFDPVYINSLRNDQN